MSQWITIGSYFNQEIDSFPVSDIISIEDTEKEAVAALEELVARESKDLTDSGFAVEVKKYGERRAVIFYGLSVTTFEIHHLS